MFRFQSLRADNIVNINNLGFIHYPIRDCDISDDSGVTALAIQLVQNIAAGRCLYLHCWGGHGRTGKYYIIIIICDIYKQ
jgi:hypothetical protein